MGRRARRLLATGLTLVCSCSGGSDGGGEARRATTTSAERAGSSAPTLPEDIGGVPLDEDGDAAAGPPTVLALDVEACFDDPQTSEVEVLADAQVTPVDCARPHDDQLYARLRHPAEADDPFPGEEAITAYAADRCLEAFEAFVGLTYRQSVLDFTAIAPTRQRWGAGDREVLCVLYHADFEKLTGSMKGARV